MSARKHNPAVSAEQYGLAQAVLSGAVRGPSMPKDVARELIEKTSPAQRQKFAEELAAKRKNPMTEVYRGKAISQMSAAEINKALERVDTERSEITREFIEAGRGHERPSEYLRMEDELSRRARENHDVYMSLLFEVERRAGPGMRTLPRGFGPLKSAWNPASDSYLQYTDHVRTESEAEEQLDGLRRQAGFIGGRVVHSVKSAEDQIRPWLVQAFFDDEPEYQEGSLEGMRRVIVPESMKSRMGIENPTTQVKGGGYDQDKKAAQQYMRLLEHEGHHPKMFRDWDGGFTVTEDSMLKNPADFSYYYAAQEADEAFQSALEAQFGKRASDARYQPKMWTPEIQSLAAAKMAADEAWINEMRRSQNPSRFDRCVADVTKRGGARDARAVCASAGRKKYGAKRFAVMSREGRRRKGNPVVATLTQGTVQGEIVQVGPGEYEVQIASREGVIDQLETDNLQTALEWARLRIFETVENPDYIESGLTLAAPLALGPAGGLVAADQQFLGKQSITSKAIDKSSKALKKLQSMITRRNPEDSAAALFEEFHGYPSEETLEVIRREHYHEFLSGIGPLIELVIENEQGTKQLVLKSPDPQEAPIEEVIVLAFNERRRDGHGPAAIKGGDQAFFVGGDQSIDLDDLIEQKFITEADIKEHMVIGKIRQVTYRTRKTFEQDGKVKIDFFHEHGKEGARGVLPMLVYKPLNPSMEVFGGRYSISPGSPALDGVSPGIVG